MKVLKIKNQNERPSGALWELWRYIRYIYFVPVQEQAHEDQDPAGGRADPRSAP